MAITFPLSFPSVTGVMSITWRAVRSDIMTMSPTTFVQQIIRNQGQRWEADITLPPMKRDNAEEFLAFLLQLDGRQGTFLLSPPGSGTARGVADGAPVINGASQTGSELAIDGLSVSTTNYLKAGDFFQLGSGSTARLHKVVKDVDSNGAGEATLDIWPNLREAPVDGSTVILSQPAGLFRLDRPIADWSFRDAALYGMAFGIMEAL